MTSSSDIAGRIDNWHMARALEIARAGRGFVEPNPLVGCVVAHGAEIVGEGWHRHYGGPHAEVEALAVAGNRAAGATMYVTLEPCCHHGKTPPCTDAVIAAGIVRVVVAMPDPFPKVSGGGIDRLRAAGITVDVGMREEEARRLNAPYLKRLTASRPWIIAKWAMSLDGRIATAAGESRWISNEASRSVVHALRGRVDAIVIGRGTAMQDDPLLTARPSGPRVATRVVVDTHANLSPASQLARTSRETPVLIAVGRESPAVKRDTLEKCGCEIYICEGATPERRLANLFEELGRRGITNVLVEGGGRLLGALFDANEIDEVHAFIAPKLIGGASAPGPLGGQGQQLMSHVSQLERIETQSLDGDIYVFGFVRKNARDDK